MRETPRNLSTSGLKFKLFIAYGNEKEFVHTVLKCNTFLYILMFVYFILVLN